MLIFDHVSYTYPFQDKPAVQDISFAVRAGEIVLCTGASGCGKSTLIRLANGLCPQYFKGVLHGTVLIDGLNTQKQSLSQIAQKAGTLFQDPEQQFFALNVEDELAFALEWANISREEMHQRVHDAAKKCSIDHILLSSLHKLSEGQKQQVGLASIQCRYPNLLILDEPTANLDPEATLRLAKHIEELKNQGMAIFIVDHRLYWLKGIADRVLVLDQGCIAKQGNFDLLQDVDVKNRYGLRAASVPDVRFTLPCCTDAGHSMLSIDDLTFAYEKGAPLFEQMHCSLPAGVCALIGNNGVGKTTLARILAGITPLQTGGISLNGDPVSPKKLPRHAGIVLQNADHQLYTRSVGEEIALCRKLAGFTDTGEHLLKRFALDELHERHPQSLSGGEKQRLVIACALAKEPALLILDEPTSGLDGANMQRIADQLRQLSNDGVCVLLISHDLELIHNVCQYALRLPYQAGEKRKISEGSKNVECEAQTRSRSKPGFGACA